MGEKTRDSLFHFQSSIKLRQISSNFFARARFKLFEDPLYIEIKLAVTFFLGLFPPDCTKFRTAFDRFLNGIVRPAEKNFTLICASRRKKERGRGGGKKKKKKKRRRKMAYNREKVSPGK